MIYVKVSKMKIPAKIRKWVEVILKALDFLKF